MFEALLWLLVLWVAVAVVGALLPGLLWLTFLSTGAFLVTAVLAGARGLDPSSR